MPARTAKKRPGKAPPAQKLRRCSRCKREKPLGEFPRNASRADGLCVYCRPCKRDADRARVRETAPAVDAFASLVEGTQHPAAKKTGEAQIPETPRLRAPALAISDELIERAAELIRTSGATRRAAARYCNVSENTFKSWLREGVDVKDRNDPRARLLFAVEMAEGDAERELTNRYWLGTALDPQMAQRFLERRFSKGDEKWARTEHLEVTDGDKAPMEVDDARKSLADAFAKLLVVPRAPGSGAPGGGGQDSGEVGHVPPEPAPAAPAADSPPG